MDGELEAGLRRAGARVTAPRRAVWQALASLPRHSTADAIVAEVGDGADAASVYRALALFEEVGLARSARLHGTAAVWERAHPDEHFHLVCEACGEVDHHVGDLVADLTRHLTDGHGFEVSAVELVVRGRCQACATA